VTTLGRYWVYWMTVAYVHDGDTIMGEVDMGRRIHVRPAAVRFARINAPELNKPGGHESRDYLRGIVQPLDLIRIVSQEWQQNEKYDRFLGEVYKGDVDLSDAMLVAGHAVTYESTERRLWPAIDMSAWLSARQPT